MEMTESQIYEGFGLEQPQQEYPAQEAQGEQEQASEIQSAEAQGADIQQEQDGQESQGTGTSQQEQDPGQEPEQQETHPKEMSLEQRRENAARRRRAETQEAIRQAVEQERERNQAEKDALVSGMGLKNPMTGKPFQSFEEYSSWKKTYDQERVQRELQEGKFSMEGLNQIIEQNPVVKRAAELVRESEQREAQAKAEAARAKAEADQAQVEAELAQIRQFNPNIQSVGDLLTMPKAKEFYELVKRGNSFVDAYKLAHYDEITQQAAAAARQQAMSNTRSKAHLTAGSQQGAGAATVPRAEMDMFRMFNPGASESDIQAYYNKYQGGK